MTKFVNITDEELGTSLPAILRRVEAGTDFVVTRGGRPIARLMAPDAVAANTYGAGKTEESRAAYSPGANARLLEGAITQLVSTPAVRRVLAVFLLNPAVEIHQREIARRSGAGLRSVQLAAKRLVGMGLLAERRDGNRLYYKAVRSERFEQVRELFAREFGIVEAISRHLSTLKRPVRWAFLFGSVAAGTDRIGSDIDLLVVSEASDDELVEPIAAAQRELGREIDLVSYRPDEFERKRAEGNHFIQSVLAQPRVDVIGGGDDA